MKVLAKLSLLILLGLTACRNITATVVPTDLAVTNPEVQVVELPLAGEASQSDAEYSGLAWYGEDLILLPQYPSRFDDSLWTIPKTQILTYLDGESDKLAPRKIPLLDEGLRDGVRGFEGYEAIAFHGDMVYLTIESNAGSKMTCYVVRGQIEPDLSVVTLESDSRQEIPHPVEIDNMCDEGLLVTHGEVITFFEANGVNINPQPVTHLFDVNLVAHGTLALPNIEYRLTDVTTTDGAGRFWTINYMYPGDAGKLEPAPDPLAAQFGVGDSHVGREAVERLIELEINEDGIELTDTAPIWLQLLPDEARNWEGLVRLDDRGFLVVTDKFPETILAFVPYP